MALKIESHVIQADRTCARCGIEIPEILFEEKAINVHVGDRIGVISGLRFTADSGYRITQLEHDSNSLCQPSSQSRA